jgi:hypothetical protein
VAEEATTAKATTIQPIGRPGEVDPAAAAPVTEGDEKRHPGKTQAGLVPKEHRHPHHPQAEEEAAQEPEDYPWTGSAGLLRG